MGKFLCALLPACFFTLWSAQAQLQIAIVGPLTGPLSDFGKQMSLGAKRAVDDLNEAGGVLGKKIQLDSHDDACNSDSAVQVANNLAKKETLFVAGHLCSQPSITASKIYADHGILQISPGSGHPKLTDAGNLNVFRVITRDDYRSAAAGAILAYKFAKRKTAFLHDNTPYEKSLVDTALRKYRQGGGVAAVVEAYSGQGKDLDGLVSKMKKTGVKAFYMPRDHMTGASIINKARTNKYRPEFVSGDAVVTDTFWKVAGTLNTGVLTTVSPDPRQTPSARKLVAAFRQSGIEPDGYTLYTYGTIQTWAAAVEKAGSTDLSKVVIALRSEQFDTVLGKIGFDEKGDVTVPITAWKVGGDRLFHEIPRSQMQHCCNKRKTTCCP